MSKSTARKLGIAVLLLALTAILTACPPQKSIAELQRDPARYADKEVAIHGVVVDSIGALETGMFEVDDGTGRIWVHSERYGVPAKGIRVGVAGVIVSTFNFAGRNFATVMRETAPRKY